MIPSVPEIAQEWHKVTRSTYLGPDTASRIRGKIDYINSSVSSIIILWAQMCDHSWK